MRAARRQQAQAALDGGADTDDKTGLNLGHEEAALRRSRVRRRACADARGRDPGARRLPHVAAAQLGDASPAGQLPAVPQDTGFDPRRPEIGLTENARVRDIDSAHAVTRRWRPPGRRPRWTVAAPANPSLACLSELRFDELEIDRSFVRTLHERAARATTVAATVGSSHSRGFELVAEGVETRRDAQAPARRGCGSAQGWLFARPPPATALRHGGAARARLQAA